MKRFTLILVSAIVLLCGFARQASAQYYFYDNYSYDTPLMFELGGSVGIMNCLTDIGGRQGVGKPFIKDLNLGNTHLNGSVYLAATYKEAVSLRLEGTFGNISAYDSILKDVQKTTNGRYERNLSFRSKISEFSLILELHPMFIFGNYQGRDVDPPRLSPYIAAGIGYFSFNPQTKNRNGKYVDLQPLSTEGQGFSEYPDRKPYKLAQFNIPIGIGLRYELSPSFNIRAELLHRTLFTDYLDDVSTKYVLTNGNSLSPSDNVFARYLTGNQLIDATDLSSNQRTNTGPLKNDYRKSQGGIRGNPNDKDSYFTFNIKIGFTFGRESR